MKHQVVVLAAGSSTRFFPFNSIHKSFFQLAGKTILERTIESIKKTDPSDIIVVLGANNFEEEKKICAQTNTFAGVKYVSQSEALGQADAILSAKKYIKDSFFVVNAQMFDFDHLVNAFLKKFEQGNYDAVLGSVETDRPDKYGVLAFNGDRVSGIVEKPGVGSETSNKRLVGVYLFSPEIFNELKKTDLSEYSLEIALNKLAKGGKVAAVSFDNKVPSLKYPWDILAIKDLILSKLKSETSQNAKIEKTAVIRGDNVYIGMGAHVCDFAIIEGPAYIGDDVVVGAYCQIRGGSVLEEGAQAERYADIKNSYIGKGTHIHSGFVGDSVIGANDRIGADFIVANKRLDRGKINSIVKGEKVDTGLTGFGVVVGNDVHMGIRVSTMPGTVIGSMSNVYPNITLRGFVSEKSDVKE